MNDQEYLATSYVELAELLSERQGTIPHPQPFETSPWICQSILQKSIRRGETGHALRAAATLLRDAPDKLWRRLAVAVFEDVGLGSLDLVAPVLMATSAKGIRQKFGGDWPVVSALVERMAAARKCRASDDLLMTIISHPRYEADRLSLTYRSQRELMQIVCGDDDIVSRAVALFYATGTDRCPVPTMRTRKGDIPFALERMSETGFPFCVLELAQRGCNRMREPLSFFVALLARDVPAHSTGYEPTERGDDIPPTVMIGDVPEWSLDWYTREGRSSIRAFLSRETPTGKWLRANVAPRDRAEVLGGLLFRVQGGLLRRRLQWPTGNYLRNVMETEAVGFRITDASEVLDLLRSDLPILTEERHHVL